MEGMILGDVPDSGVKCDSCRWLESNDVEAIMEQLERAESVINGT